MGADRKNIKGFFSKGNATQSLLNNRIFNLLSYNGSVLFLAYDRSGIVRFNTLTHSIKLLNPTPTADDINVKDVWVRQYFKQSDTCIYLCTSLGNFQYNPVRNTLGRIVDHNVGLYPASGMSGLFQDHDGAFWFFNRIGELCCWKPGVKLQCIRNPIIQKQLSKGERRLFDYDSLHLLVATANGNYLFDRNEKNLTQLRFRGMFGDELSSDPVTAVFRTRDDNLFLVFLSGYLAQVRKQQQVFVYKELVTKNQPPVNVAFVLDDTTYRKRYITSCHSDYFFVEILVNGQIDRIRKPWPERISANRIIFDSAGRIWVCQGKGIVQIDRKTGFLRKYDPDETAETLFDIVEVAPGKFYVGSFGNGLFYFEPDAGIFRKVPENNGWIATQVFSLYFDKAENVLWVGTVRNGLFSLNLRKGEFRQYLHKSGEHTGIGGD